VRGDSCAAFYWHQQEKTKASMRGEWFMTGDRYRRTADGVYVCAAYRAAERSTSARYRPITEPQMSPLRTRSPSP
jgi:acyl-CoA synthetase (AMP-forming)/AMP-acid ligase II